MKPPSRCQTCFSKDDTVSKCNRCRQPAKAFLCEDCAIEQNKCAVCIKPYLSFEECEHYFCTVPRNASKVLSRWWPTIIRFQDRLSLQQMELLAEELSKCFQDDIQFLDNDFKFAEVLKKWK